MSDEALLDRTCQEFLNSLLQSSKHHTLCLNIREPDYAAEAFVRKELEAKGQGYVFSNEPTPTEFSRLLGSPSDDVVVIHFADMDKHPKCLDALLAHVQKDDPGLKVVIVSRDWNSHNTEREREIWRARTLFYERAPSK